MKLLSDFGKGFSNSFKGFSILFEKGLWHYTFYPLLIWLLIWLSSIYSFILLADYITSKIQPYLSFENIADNAHWLSFLKGKLTGAFSFIITWVLKIIFWFIGSIFSKYILLIILSPLFALLSERTDEKITGANFPFKIIQLLKDIFRGILITIRNLLMELLIGFGLWMLTLAFPPLFFITFPLSLVVGWYFIGFSLLDYNCERYKYKVGESIQFIKQNRGYAMGIGCVYSIFLALPTFAGDLIGLMFGPTIAVIGATLSFLQITKKETNLS